MDKYIYFPDLSPLYFLSLPKSKLRASVSPWFNFIYQALAQALQEVICVG